MTIGSVLGVAPAHADTLTTGDCTLLAKLLIDRDNTGKLRSFSVRGVGDVRCVTNKSTISAELLLHRNGVTVQRTSGTWTNTRSLGVTSMWTAPYQGSNLTHCGDFQSVLNVYIGGAGPISVTSGTPVAGCG